MYKNLSINIKSKMKLMKNACLNLIINNKRKIIIPNTLINHQLKKVRNVYVKYIPNINKKFRLEREYFLNGDKFGKIGQRL